MPDSADAISARLLHAVDRTLRRRVRPALADPGARAELDFVIRAVDFVQRRQAGIMPALETLLAHEQAALAGHAEPVAGGTIQALEERRMALEQSLVARIPELIAQAGGPGVEGQGARAVIRDLVAAQTRFTAMLDPRASVGSRTFLGADPIEEGGTGSGADDGAIHHALARYVSDRFAAEGGRLRSVRGVPGGYSKQTLFCTIDRDGLPPIEAVIRMDQPGPVERSVVDEYPLLVLLHGQGLPVAQPYWLERDATILGGAFMATARCPGTPDGAALRGDAAAADRFARALAALMARLHGVDVAPLQKEGEARSAADCMRAEIGRFHDLYRVGAKAPQPMLDIAYQWLLAHIPAELEAQAPSLIHGDIGFHNLLIADGLPTALLDWETAHLGDPAEELYYTKAYLDGIVDWDRFLRYYEEAGGRPCPASSRTFYDVWRGARIAANCARIRTAFEEEAPDAIGYGVLAYIFGRRLELEAANKVVDALDTP